MGKVSSKLAILTGGETLQSISLVCCWYGRVGICLLSSHYNYNNLMDFRLESCPPLCSPPPAEILGVASCKDPTWPELQTKSRTSLDIYKLLFTEGGILHIFFIYSMSYISSMGRNAKYCSQTFMLLCSPHSTMY